MNEVILTTQYTTLEEFSANMFGFCLTIFLGALFAYDLAKGVASGIIYITKRVGKHFKTKKRQKPDLPTADYTVINDDGLGIIYKNEKEYVLACNYYENALAIKEILIEDELPFT